MVLISKYPVIQAARESRAAQVQQAVTAAPRATNEDLKPCPFCDAPAKHVRENDGHATYRFVRCTVVPEHRAGNGCYNAAIAWIEEQLEARTEDKPFTDEIGMDDRPSYPLELETSE